MSLLEDDVLTSKDSITCENCKHVNILTTRNNKTRKKKPRMLYVDDSTWYLFMARKVDFKTTQNFLAFLLGIYERDKIKLRTPLAELDQF